MSVSTRGHISVLGTDVPSKTSSTPETRLAFTSCLINSSRVALWALYQLHKHRYLVYRFCVNRISLFRPSRPEENIRLRPLIERYRPFASYVQIRGDVKMIIKRREDETFSYRSRSVLCINDLTRTPRRKHVESIRLEWSSRPWLRTIRYNSPLWRGWSREIDRRRSRYQYGAEICPPTAVAGPEKAPSLSRWPPTMWVRHWLTPMSPGPLTRRRTTTCVVGVADDRALFHNLALSSTKLDPQI